MAARGSFSSKAGFIAASAGSAVGLGNIWKFPFEVGEGGGAAFVLMYLLFCFLLCFPVMLTAIAIGRKTQHNAVGSFDTLGFPRWNFIGKAGVIANIIVLSFYNVVAGWTFGYFVEMMQGNFGIGAQFGEFVTDIFTVGTYSILFMLATSYIVSRGISGGIEKASKILMPTLIILIIALAGYALTLPNAGAGIKFYLVPDFSKISMVVASSALGQAFFSLSIGMGILITYGSYVSREDNLISSAALITLADVGIALISGLMIFPFLGYLTEGSMEGVAGGAGLVFVTLPGVFETLGTAGVIIGSLFFLLLSFAALTSTVSLLEVPVAYATEEFKLPRKWAVIMIASIIFLLSIPSMLANGYSPYLSSLITYFGQDSPVDFMTFLGHIVDSWLPMGGFLMIVFAAYVWKKKNLHKEITRGFPGYGKSFLIYFIDISVQYIAPAVLLFLFLSGILTLFFNIYIL